MNSCEEVISDNWPKSPIILNIKAIKARGLTWRKIKESRVDFLLGKITDKLEAVRLSQTREIKMKRVGNVQEGIRRPIPEILIKQQKSMFLWDPEKHYHRDQIFEK